ncbi:hypothetical protein P7349_15280, partial [Staphylococcus aureus]|nr:hypothetical protein [Staphylococcus aureus]
GGYVDGYIETIEETDSSAIDIDYHTAVDSEAGHVGGYTESSDTPSYELSKYLFENGPKRDEYINSKIEHLSLSNSVAINLTGR